MRIPPFVQIAHALDGPDRGTALDEDALLRALRSDTPAWVHIDGNHPDAADWVAQHLDYLDPQALRALLDGDTRARLKVLGDGMILILRGINFNEGEDPENMLSVRMWIDASRIITISLRPVRAVDEMDRALRSGEGPADAGAFLARLVGNLTANIAAFQKDLDLRAEELEAKIIAESAEFLRRKVVRMRLRIIASRRYLGPQRDVLGSIQSVRLPFLDRETHREVEEEHLKLVRIVEDIDELRDQVSVLREELSAQISDRLNRNMFVLSVLTAIFMPLSFLTGVFGMNVAGLPGLVDPRAFLWVCLVMGSILALQLGLLWRLQWFGRLR